MKASNLPLAVVANTINLMTPRTVPILIDTLQKIELSFNVPIGLIVFDTFAKLIAAGGGDEDKARDQGAVFANIQRVREHVDAHVAIVGHTGKDVSRGARGSNAILGDADVMVRISGETVRTATIEKANDLPEGPVFAFRSQIHDLGTGYDGDPVSVVVVASESCGLSDAWTPRVIILASSPKPPKLLSARSRRRSTNRELYLRNRRTFRPIRKSFQ